MRKAFAAAFIAHLLATSTAAQQAPAAASERPAPPATPQQDESRSDGEEPAAERDIVVTAQIRSERLQDVPIAVNVVSNDQIAASGIVDMRELNTIVPGLNIQANVGSFQPALRGITTQSNVVENPVALYIDGVYYANQRDGLRDLLDIEQITVLKGPQGTLFGRNATAGVIQIATRRPTRQPQAELRVGYDDYETFRGSAHLSGGLAEDLAASVSASYITQGQGFGRSLSNGMELYKLYDNLNLRGKLLYDLDDKTELTLIADYLYRSDSGRSYQPYPGTTFAYPGFGPVTSRYDSYSATPAYNRFRSRGLSLRAEHDFDVARLVSITAYRRGTGGFRFDFTSVATPFIISTADLDNRSFSQEVQLISDDDGPFRWVAGLYLFYSETEYENFPRVITQPFPPIPTVREINGPAIEKARSAAGFAQVDYDITPNTTLTLGGRFTYERRTIAGFNATTLVTGRVITVPAPDYPVTINEPTWRVALSHELAPDVSVYASWNRGLKSGGFNIATPSSPPYLSEKLDAYEVGFKSQLFDRNLTFNASAFFYKYSNLQVVTFIGGALTPIVANGAEAELYGFDTDFQARLSPAFSLSGGFQLLHSEFTDYPSAPISRTRPGGGAIIAPGSATGNRLPLAQDFVGTLAADYRAAIGPVNLGLNVTAAYNSDYVFEPDNVLRQPAYTLLNASVRLSDRKDRRSLTFAVTNILDEAIITNIGTQNYAYFANYSAPPRIFSVTAGVRF